MLRVGAGLARAAPASSPTSTGSTTVYARRLVSNLALSKPVRVNGRYLPETPLQTIARIANHRRNKPLNQVVKNFTPGLKLDDWTQWQRMRLGGALLKFDAWSTEDVRTVRHSVGLDHAHMHHLYIRSAQNAFNSDEGFSHAAAMSVQEVIANAVASYDLAARQAQPKTVDLRAMHILNMIAKRPHPQRNELINQICLALAHGKHDLRQLSSRPAEEGHLVPLYIRIFRSKDHLGALSVVLEQNLKGEDARRVLDVLCGLWYPECPTLPAPLFQTYLAHVSACGMQLHDQKKLVQQYLRLAKQQWTEARQPLALAMEASFSEGQQLAVLNRPLAEERACKLVQLRQFGRSVRTILRNHRAVLQLYRTNWPETIQQHFGTPFRRPVPPPHPLNVIRTAKDWRIVNRLDREARRPAHLQRLAEELQQAKIRRAAKSRVRLLAKQRERRAERRKEANKQAWVTLKREVVRLRSLAGGWGPSGWGQIRVLTRPPRLDGKPTHGRTQSVPTKTTKIAKRPAAKKGASRAHTNLPFGGKRAPRLRLGQVAAPSGATVVAQLNKTVKRIVQKPYSGLTTRDIAAATVMKAASRLPDRPLATRKKAVQSAKSSPNQPTPKKVSATS